MPRQQRMWEKSAISIFFKQEVHLYCIWKRLGYVGGITGCKAWHTYTRSGMTFKSGAEQGDMNSRPTPRGRGHILVPSSHSEYYKQFWPVELWSGLVAVITWRVFRLGHSYSTPCILIASSEGTCEPMKGVEIEKTLSFTCGSIFPLLEICPIRLPAAHIVLAMFIVASTTINKDTTWRRWGEYPSNWC